MQRLGEMVVTYVIHQGDEIEHTYSCALCNGTGFEKPNKNNRRYWRKKCKGVGKLDWLEKIFGKRWYFDYNPKSWKFFEKVGKINE
jgi:hypothetical protein